MAERERERGDFIGDVENIRRVVGSYLVESGNTTLLGMSRGRGSRASHSGGGRKVKGVQVCRRHPRSLLVASLGKPFFLLCFGSNMSLMPGQCHPPAPSTHLPLSPPFLGLSLPSPSWRSFLSLDSISFLILEIFSWASLCLGCWCEGSRRNARNVLGLGLALAQ